MSSTSTLLSEDAVSSHVYNHMLDVDRLLTQHLVNARAELTQKRRRFSGQMVAALSESVSKRLKSKDDEIEHLRKLNWALEERIKNLSVESNAWRYLAQTNEAAEAAVRADLDRVLAAQAATATAAESDDAESCCGDNEVIVSYNERRRMCRGCRRGEASVLLLPCRHLCLCTACSSAVDTCPICKCGKNGSVNVNLC